MSLSLTAFFAEEINNPLNRSGLYCLVAKTIQ